MKTGNYNDGKFINKDTYLYYANTNEIHLTLPLKGIVVEFPGLDGGSCLGGSRTRGNYSTKQAIDFGEKGILVAFIFTVMKFYIWTLTISFKLTVKQIYANSFKLAIANLKMNFLCIFAHLLVYAIYFLVIYYLGRFAMVMAFAFMLIVCTLPGFSFLLIQYCTFPAIKKYMIDPYYKEHPDADIELRRNLGLEVPEDDIDEEDEEIDE